MFELKLVLSPLVVILLSPAVLAQTPPVLVFEHANVIDGIASAPARDVTIIVKDGKIASISHTPPPLSQGAQRFDLTGRWLLLLVINDGRVAVDHSTFGGLKQR